MSRLGRCLLLVAVVLGFAPHLAQAVQPDEILRDPRLEARARDLSSRLRCMVCQNQSIDDSDAELARDLRVLVRERLLTGDSDREVIDFLVARYGEYVLLQPRLSAGNALLWATPFLLLLLGGGLLVRRARAHKRGGKPASTKGDERLNAQERARLARILKN